MPSSVKSLRPYLAFAEPMAGADLVCNKSGVS